MNNKLKELQASVEKHFGKGSVMLLGDEPREKVEVIPTGIVSLDRAMGVGGFPRGRMVEIYGPESSGKTTLALYGIAQCQKLGLPALFIDAEHSLDLGLAEKLGVNINELLISQPESAEQSLGIVEHSAKSGQIGLIVVDSVAALVPEAELQGDMGASHVGLQARLMSQACRKLTGHLANSGTTLIWINQLRMKIGVMFGNPETTTGGNALKFYATQRIEVRKGQTIKSGNENIGHVMNVTVRKNKLSAPGIKSSVDLLYGKGIDTVGDILNIAVEKNIVDKAGAWYSYNDEKLGQGKNKSSEYLAEHENILDEITEKINSEV